MANNLGFHHFAIGRQQPLPPNANTPEARRFLRALHKLGPCHPYQIAERLDITPQTVSGKLNKLRAWGYVEGGGGKIGKRKDSGVPWQLTDAGRAAIGR